MSSLMKAVSESRKMLSIEDRNLLSVAYKNVVGARRASWRILQALTERADQKGEEENTQICKDYMGRVEVELEQMCRQLVGLLDGHLLPGCTEDTEATVFYLKMKGDYHRYVAE